MESTSTHTTIPSFLSLVCWLLDCLCPESPAFSGVAVVELLKRPSLMKARSGSVQVVAELARLSSKSPPHRLPPPPPSNFLFYCRIEPAAADRSLRFSAELCLPRSRPRRAQKGRSGGAVAGVRRRKRPLGTRLDQGERPHVLLPWSVFSGNPPPPSPAEE